jgi:hypothetical protein
MPQLRIRAGLVCLTIGAAACGGQARALDDGAGAAPADISSGAPGGSGAPDTADSPGTPDTSDTTTQPPPEPPPPDAVDEPVQLGEPPHIDLVAGRVLELFQMYCGTCHSNGVAAGGFGDVLDISKLIERGLIVPGSSATSPLLERMSDDRVHPMNAARRPRPLRGDLVLLARYIDDLALAEAPDCAPHDFMSQDDVYALLSADIVAQPAPDRPFVRYLELAYASNAGLCGPALARERHALFKMINSVSTASEIAIPRAIDAAELVYRIDLRDYGWDREIDLIGDGSVLFSDAWLALVAGVGRFASELEGPDANTLREHTGTAVPLLPVNAFVHTSTIGDLYYALIGVSGSLDEKRLGLGVDLYAAIENDEVRRAGFFQGGAEARESMVLRFEQGTAMERSYWILEDQRIDDAESIVDDPLDIGEGGHQTIYNLPNGMQAYWVESQNGIRLGEIAACHSCHGEGLLPVTDQLRDYVETNPGNFDQGSFASALVQYPMQIDLDALMLRDSEIHLSAVERAGVPRGTPDPISRVFLQFERDPLTAAEVAAELGVPLNTLRENLPSLDPRLQVLGTPEGTIDRFTFGDTLLGLRCALWAPARNRPLGCP